MVGKIRKENCVHPPHGGDGYCYAGDGGYYAEMSYQRKGQQRYKGHAVKCGGGKAFIVDKLSVYIYRYVRTGDTGQRDHGGDKSGKRIGRTEVLGKVLREPLHYRFFECAVEYCRNGGKHKTRAEPDSKSEAGFLLFSS